MSGRKNTEGKLTVRPRPRKNRNTGALLTSDFIRIQEHLDKLMSQKNKKE